MFITRLVVDPASTAVPPTYTFVDINQNYRSPYCGSLAKIKRPPLLFAQVISLTSSRALQISRGIELAFDEVNEKGNLLQIIHPHFSLSP